MNCYVVMLWDYEAAQPAAVYTNEDAAKADAEARQCDTTVSVVALDATEPPEVKWGVYPAVPWVAGDEYHMHFCQGEHSDEVIAEMLEEGIALVSAVGADDAFKLGKAKLEQRGKEGA